MKSDFGTAYALLRITMGVNFFVHGAGRLPHLDAFAAGTAKEFVHTPLPAAFVVAFAYAIPFVEIVLGVAIALGSGLRFALPISSAYMISLMFGTLVRGAYAVVAEQLVYSLIFAILTAFRSYDRMSIDARRGRELPRRA